MNYGALDVRESLSGNSRGANNMQRNIVNWGLHMHFIES